ncbi:caspase family protein [Dactylosporangium darangshiense]|uniref:caspase family protein n=1 Tax=Dactylosporangium darangshiense TaxID=579108 RepID=UPI0036280CDA
MPQRHPDQAQPPDRRPPRPRPLPRTVDVPARPQRLRAALTPRTPRAPRSTALLLSGCRDDEYSYDATFDGRPNGAFTYVALTALASLPDNATYRDWLHAIRDRLPSQDYPQTPALQATRTQQSWPILT